MQSDFSFFPGGAVPELATDDALAGIRIVDFTWSFAGPMATRLLAAMGAEVIKVEWPERPDMMRVVLYPSGVSGGFDHGAFFSHTSAGKRHITLNARDPRGLELILKLIEKCDVVTESYSASVFEHWGLSYDRMVERKPDIIYASFSGFGHSGRRRNYETWGPSAQAINGLTFISGLPDQRAAGWGFSYMDVVGSYMIDIAILGAVYARERTGQGQYIDLSQVELGIPLAGTAILDYAVNGRRLRRKGFPPGNRAVTSEPPHENALRGPVAAPHGIYRTNGGGHNDYIAIAVENNDDWERLRRAMGEPAWASDLELASMSGRIRRQDDIDKNVEVWTVGHDKYVLMERLQEAGIAAGAVQSAADSLERDPQLSARGFFETLDHPVLGRHRFEGIPIKMSKTQPRLRSAGPTVGQDNDYLFRSLLGLSSRDILDLTDDGVLWPKGKRIIDGVARPEPRMDREVRPAAESSSAPKRQTRRAAPKSGPLDGVRVLEISEEIGQFAGKLLADLGADVIKIEPTQGATTRRVGPFYRDRPDPNNSLYFWYYNTSKRSITLNLECADGKDLLQRLVKTSDVVLEAGPLGYLEGLGLGYDSLRTDNANLIHCAISPFGQTGPWRNYKTNDLVHLALGGICAVCGYDDVPGAPPIGPSGGHAWHLASLHAVIGVIAALQHRERTDDGQYIDISVHDSTSASSEWAIPVYEYLGEPVYRQTARHARFAPTAPWHHVCRDGVEMCCLCNWLDGGRFPKLVSWLAEDGFAEDLADPQYEEEAVRGGGMEAREAALGHVQEVIGRFCAAHDSDAIFERAQNCGLPWAPVLTPDELLSDPQLQDRDFFVEVDHPELDEAFSYPGSALRFSHTPAATPRRAPLLGEHTIEILAGIGIEPDQAAILREHNAI